MNRFILILLLFSSLCLKAQYKADNVKYTTVYPQDLCKTLQSNPGFVLLDVRSQGEFDDTLSSSQSLNIGHIENARHIDIRQLPDRWKELLPFKDKPLFIYCSHSQRSRRASRMLSDSGFTKIYNVNQGLTGFYIDGISNDPCNDYRIITNLPYKIVSPKQLVQTIQNNVSYTLLDIREDSVYNSKTQSPEINIQGRFKEVIHIPISKLSEKLSGIPKKTNLLLIDSYGAESPGAAKLLLDHGFENVSILFNGMDEWIDYVMSVKEKQPLEWIPGESYRIISADEFLNTISKNKQVVLVDVREKDEFNNQSKTTWRNIGQIKNAINIPATGIETGTGSLPSKEASLLIYGFNNNDYIYHAAKALQQMGYKNISVLRGGIWNLRWSAHNQKGKENLNNVVINIPEENK